MSVFEDSRQFYDTVGELLLRVTRDPHIGPTVAQAETVIQLRHPTLLEAKDLEHLILKQETLL